MFDEVSRQALLFQLDTVPLSLPLLLLRNVYSNEIQPTMPTTSFLVPLNSLSNSLIMYIFRRVSEARNDKKGRAPMGV